MTRRRARVAAACSLVLSWAAACGGGARLGDRGGAATPVPSSSSAPSSSALPATTAPAPALPSPAASGVAVCWEAPAAATSPGPPGWTDRTASSGLVGPLAGVMAHAVAWGDVDGDGWADLFVGTFADRPLEQYQVRGASGPAPDRLLLGGPAGFRIDPTFPETRARTSGAVFADLDGDGDLDLVLARNVTRRADRPEQRQPSVVMENRGGRFTVAAEILAGRGARSVGVLDYDGDGRLDLLVTEDRFTGGSSAVLRNEGGLSFVDTTAAAGLPADVHGLGVAVSDFDRDGWPDVFVAGSNRLFHNQGGRFQELDASVLTWPAFGPEDDVAGVAVGDLDRDGWPDLVVGHHYGSTTDGGGPVPVRIYRNLGGDSGPGGGAGPAVRFADVTAAAGVPGFPTKAPHVEVADFDADGWPDILVTASAGASRPTVLRNLGVGGGGLTFAPVGGPGGPPGGASGSHYWVSGAVLDTDRDGRLEVVLAEFDAGLPSLLLANEGPGGHWLEVAVSDAVGGVGTVVEVYRPGEGRSPQTRLGRVELGVTTGYGAGQAAVARFGLAAQAEVELVVTPPRRAAAELGLVAADRRVRVGGGC